MTEWRFAPAEISLEGGGVAVIELRNDGDVVHEWAALQRPITSESDFRDDLVLGRLLVQPAGVGQLTLELPAPGVYQVVCPIPGHIANGMVGTLEVRSG